MRIAALALTLSACGEKAEAPAPPPPDIVVTEVKKQDVPIYKEWVATTDGYINAQIRAKVSGYLLTRDYKQGGLVKAGDLMFQIDPRQFQATLDQAKGELARNEAVLLKNKQDVTRYTPLAKEGAVSQKTLDDSIQAVYATQAMVDSARAAVEQAQLNLGWTKVMSPIDGIAGIAVAQIGDLIQESTELTTVSQVDPIKVNVPVSEQEYLVFANRIRAAELGKDKPVADLEMTLSDGTVFPHKGTFDVANRQVDLRTGTILVQTLFPNPENILRPGQFAVVRAPVRTAKDALLVPQRSVANVQGQNQVAVVDKDNKVEIRNVEVGDKVGEEWIVTSGLTSGERIVVEGLQKVRPGMVINPKPYAAPTTPGAVPKKG